MGPVEKRLYDETETTAFTHADWLGRKVLRQGVFVCRNVYKWQGKYYTVIGGRAVECDHSRAYHAEREQQKLDRTMARH